MVGFHRINSLSILHPLLLACSSIWLEHTPYKGKVGSSNLPMPNLDRLIRDELSSVKRRVIGSSPVFG